MLILGTGGHIDHGKTSLVRALTGRNTDRLKEEQQRGMTIDLGFASLTLPSGQSLGIIDVPGHHRFIKNMLAGVGGINIFLLVVAADDGWMPQTQEHFNIVDLLGISQGVVALTKSDLVDDEWLDLVEEDIRQHLVGTGFADAPIVRVSSTTGTGLDALVRELDVLSQIVTQPEDYQDPLLWVDRVFSIKGAGTVVTGTLTQGSLVVDRQVVLGPYGHDARIRGLQVHDQDVTTAVPGSRTAVNLVGLEVQDVHRGMYLHYPGLRRPVRILDAYLRLLPDAPALLTLQQVKFYRGSLETMARVKLLGQDRLDPGNTSFAQLTLEVAAAFRPGDPFVLRHPGQDVTSGGGIFLQEGIPARGRRLRLVGPDKYRQQWPFATAEPFLDLQHLQKLLQADQPERARLTAASRPFWDSRDLLAQVGQRPEGVIDLHHFVLTENRWEELQNHVATVLKEYHARNPLSPGLGREVLRNQLGLPPNAFNAAIQAMSDVHETAHVLHHSSHLGALTEEQERQANVLLEQLAAKRHEPPTIEQLVEEQWPKQLLDALLFQKRLTLLEGQYVVTPAIIAAVQQELNSLGDAAGFTVAQFRDMLGTTRKYALAYLDYFDRRGVTLREGDLRRLRQKA